MSTLMDRAKVPVKLEIGDTVKGQYIVKKKLGEGACGAVYLVHSISNSKVRAAMKVEPIMKSKDDEILKMEVFVLKRLQKSKHVCRLLLAGRSETYSFMVMTLLGKELSELRRRQPDRKLSGATGIKIGIQVVQALYDMHVVGFVHRDVKPSNFACGHVHKNLIQMFDFGLARQILIRDATGKMKLREPRSKVSFRGTVRYCSINVHNNKEQGRHDDLISMVYMLIELVTSTLPWKGLTRRDSGQKKQTVNDKQLFQNCPASFVEVYGMLRKLSYNDTPRYDKLRKIFKDDLIKMNKKLTDPFEWEKKDEKSPTEDKHSANKETDEKVEKDQSEDTDTGRDADESIESQASEGASEGVGYAREDTLDEVGELDKHEHKPAAPAAADGKSAAKSKPTVDKPTANKK